MKAMKAMKHWQDPVNAVVGAWVAVSPWVLGFADHEAATIGSVAAGLALLAAALGAIFVPRAWEEWVSLALGAWLIASPWVLGFAAFGAATASTVAAGAVVVVLALWVLGTDRDYGGWWSDRLAH
jgi:hypothetical protein